MNESKMPIDSRFKSKPSRLLKIDEIDKRVQGVGELSPMLQNKKRLKFSNVNTF